MLPLIPEPIVSRTVDIHIVRLDKLLNAVGKKPINNCWILYNCFVVTGTALLVFGAYQRCQLWPLSISGTVSEKTVGSPNVSTMSISLLLYLNQY